VAPAEQVSELEIAEAKAEIGAEVLDVKPASAVTLAGMKKNCCDRGFVKAGGNGGADSHGKPVKDPDYTMEFHRG